MSDTKLTVEQLNAIVVTLRAEYAHDRNIIHISWGLPRRHDETQRETAIIFQVKEKLRTDAQMASVEATRDNADVNGAPGIAVTRADLRREEGPWAPTVLANLVRPLLLEVAAGMTRPPERMILSGLLREEAAEVAAAFARHGLREQDRRHGGEWAAVLLAG